MSCASTRLVSVDTGRDANGNFRGVTEGEEVRCVRASGHPGYRHYGFLSDLTSVGWEGYPIDAIPQQECRGQEAFDFHE